VSERFSRAVEQLGQTDGRGKPAQDVRTGALFSVMRIGIDSELYTEPALLIVATYVRTHFARPPKLTPNGCNAPFEFTQKQPDVANALGFVLHQIAAKLRKKDEKDKKDKKVKTYLLGLRGANLTGLTLDGLNLSGFDLTGIKFSHASLKRADFSDARLNGGNFEHACLIGANLTGASVVGAKFTGATLTGRGLRLLSKAQKAQLRTTP
jgi:hypothetical protein